MAKLLHILLLFRNPFRALLDRLSLIKSPLVEHRLRNGLAFWCRPGSSDLMSVFDIFTSQKHSAYLRQFSINAGDIVIDIGANIGVFSLQAAKAGAVVDAYEPIADTYQVLKTNIIANHYVSSVNAWRLGISTTAGPRKIFLGNRNHSMSCSFYHHENTSRDAIEIDTIPFSTILQRFRRVDLLKIDCEGAEFEFLPGADLSKVRKIVLEYHEIAPGFDHQRLEVQLRDAGFTTRVKPWKPGFGILYAWREA